MTYADLMYEFMRPHAWQPGITLVVLAWAREDYDEDWVAEMVA